MSELSNVLFRSLGLPYPVAASYNDLTRRVDGNFDANNDGQLNELDRNGQVEAAELFEEVFNHRWQYQPQLGQLAGTGLEDPYVELPEIKKHVEALFQRYQPATDLDKALLLFRSLIQPALTFKFGTTRYFGLEASAGGLEIFPNMSLTAPQRIALGDLLPREILATPLEQRIANCQEFNQLLVMMLRVAGLTASANAIPGTEGVMSHSEVVAIIGDKTYRLDPINLRFFESPGQITSDRMGLANHYLNEGMLQILQQNFDQALARFNLALELDPGSFTAWYCQGLAYLNLPDLGRAAAAFERVISLQPTEAAAWELLALVLEKMSEPAKALSAANRAIALNINSPTAWTIKAKLATTTAEREIYLLKGAEAWCFLGDRAADQGQFRVAIEDYSKAIKLKADYYPAWKKRAQVYAKLGNFNRAISDFEQVIIAVPQDAEAWNGQGVVHLMQSHLHQATICFDEALRLEPKNSKYLANRGAIYLRQNQPQAALTLLEQALTVDPNCTQAQLNLVNALLMLKRNEEAGRQLDVVLTREPNNLIALSLKVDWLLLQQQAAAALSWCEQIIDLNPLNIEAWEHAGNILTNLNQAAEASLALSQVARIKKFKLRLAREL